MDVLKVRLWNSLKVAALYEMGLYLQGLSKCDYLHST